MGQTPTWALPYPEEADPADVPVDMQELANRLEVVLSQLKTGGSIPGEVRLWSGSALPAQATYGHWVWADGASYDSATYPIAAANIAASWKTFGGQADPGAGKFRVPDLRGVVPAGMDAMPGGARANRVTRAAAATVGGLLGVEYVTLTAATMPAHAHGVNTGNESADHTHSGTTGNETSYHTHGGTTNLQSQDHAHASLSYPAVGSSGGTSGFSMTTGVSTGNISTSGVNADHNHAFGTGNQNIFHVHNFTSGGRSVAHSHAISSEGGGGAHENLQPTAFVPYIVKLDN